MENYEQKYKEMLERYDKILQAVKELQDANPHDEGVQNFVNDNFPELQVSEDERIRKAIHIYLDWLDGRKDYAPKGKYSIRDMIAWLEKQGEQKPAEWSEEDDIGLGDALWAIEQASTIAKDENDVGTLWYAEKWLKSLRPQPKQEWNEENGRDVLNKVRVMSVKLKGV